LSVFLLLEAARSTQPKNGLRGGSIVLVNELSRPEVSTLPRQIDEARARYAEALEQLNEATCFYERTVPKGDDLRDLFPDECERALAIQKAIQDCAYWDAEASAAEIRLARLGRIALKFGRVSPLGL
jgi:hypothetical protein